MKWISLPVKVAVLMILAIALVSAAGYLTYQSLSSIVATAEVKSRPDLRLLMIRDIAADLDRAESSVRLYQITRDKRDINPYYGVISGIDAKIDSLTAAAHNDRAFLAQIDTISSLIEESILVWNDIIDLYHSDSLEAYIHSLTAKIAVGTLTQKQPGILKRVFSRKAIREEEQRIKAEEQKALLEDINKIRQQDSIANSRILATESRLALTNSEIRERMYMLISRMENEVITSIKANALAARRMADQTYQRLMAFAVLGTMLVLTVLIVVIRYVRKAAEYQSALENSKEEAEMLAKTREMFVANMSHEIRTPVNAIHGFSRQLILENTGEKSRKMLEVIHTASEHLARIVNDVLDYSKLRNDSIVLDRTHFVLQPVFEELRMLFFPAAQGNNSRLYFTIGENVPEVLYGDPYRLRQILLNLIGNAVKFTPNGEIRFSADSANITGNVFELVLTVQDTGIGIRKDKQETVFDDFTQAEAGISRKFGGTGLGLSIVKKLVELHNGNVHLESTEGKGTTITCLLPYQTGKRELIRNSSETVHIPEKIKKLKVLVVDDEEYNRLLFRTIFKRWSIRSDEVSDGYQALEKIKLSKYDIVFMDARMPGLSGLEVSSTIRHELGLDDKKIAIIGTSATHSAEDIHIYLSAGMNAFLPKPFTEKMLVNVILSVTGNYFRHDDDIVVMNNDKIGPVNSDSHGVNLKNLYHIADNDISFLRQMLTSFIQSTEQGLEGLEESIRSGDLKAVQEIAHRISSPCRHVGADRLYSNLKMIEEHSKSLGNIDILADLSKDSKSEFLIIKKGLQQHLKTL